MALFFGCLGAVVSIVVWFDPYDWLGRRGYVAAAARSDVDVLLAKMIKLNHFTVQDMRRVDVFVVGDSRARLLTAAPLSIVTSHFVANGAVGGLGIEESLTVLEHHVSRFPALKQIVLVAPFERICQAAKPNQVRDVIRMADSAPHYFLHWENLKMSLSVWRYSAVPRGDDGALRNVAVPKTPERVVIDIWHGYFRSYDPCVADQRVESLGNTVRRIQKRGLNVTLWMPPLRKDVAGYIDELMLNGEKARIVAALRKIAPLVDSVTESSIGGVRFEFIDPVHTDSGPAILSELLHSRSL